MPFTFHTPFLTVVLSAMLMGLSGLSLPAWAEKADRDKPMHIEADNMRHDDNKQLTQFNGQVVATKGTLVLRADRMEVQQDSQGKQVARLWAAPNERVFFRQKREGLDEFTEGEAETLTYDNQADVVTLVKRAEVRMLRGTVVADQIQGQTIVFNNTTEVIQVDGRTQDSSNARDQRVRATLTPRQNPSAPATAPAQTAPRPVLRNSPGLAMPSKP
jgi:lipopolysaccharide export system protein LptA